MSRQAAEKRGHWGEHIAAIWLILHGWRILGRRIRVRAGEVDIIARRGRKIAFVEVKTRRRASDLDLAIDAQRLRRVRAAAIALADQYACTDDTIQIDVILIAPFTLPRHLTNVSHG